METFMRPAANAPPHNESMVGALGIPELMPPIGGGTFKVTSECSNHADDKEKIPEAEYGNDYHNHVSGMAHYAGTADADCRPVY